MRHSSRPQHWWDPQLETLKYLLKVKCGLTVGGHSYWKVCCLWKFLSLPDICSWYLGKSWDTHLGASIQTHLLCLSLWSEPQLAGGTQKASLENCIPLLRREGTTSYQPLPRHRLISSVKLRTQKQEGYLKCISRGPAGSLPYQGRMGEKGGILQCALPPTWRVLLGEWARMLNKDTWVAIRA